MTMNSNPKPTKPTKRTPKVKGKRRKKARRRLFRNLEEYFASLRG